MKFIKGHIGIDKSPANLFFLGFVRNFWMNVPEVSLLKREDVPVLAKGNIVNTALKDAIAKHVQVATVTLTVTDHEVHHQERNSFEQYVKGKLAHMVARELVSSGKIAIQEVEDRDSRIITFRIDVPILMHLEEKEETTYDR